MFTDEQFEQLEAEEREITLEAIAVMILLLSETNSSLEKELRSFYQKYGKDGVVTYQQARKWVSDTDHRKRLNVLLEKIIEEFDFTLRKLNPQFKAFLLEVIKKENLFFDINPLEVDTDKILTTKWGEEQLTWSERLQKDVMLWALYLGTDVKRALLQRATIDSVIQKMNKRFDSIYNAVKTLGLSESTAVGSITRKNIFKTLGVGKYSFYTLPDERRCETCGSMHGLIFPMTAYEVGVTASPLHPRCRCYEIPVWD